MSLLRAEFRDTAGRFRMDKYGKTWRRQAIFYAQRGDLYVRGLSSAPMKVSAPYRAIHEATAVVLRRWKTKEKLVHILGGADRAEQFRREFNSHLMYWSAHVVPTAGELVSLGAVDFGTVLMVMLRGVLRGVTDDTPEEEILDELVAEGLVRYEKKAYVEV